MGIDYLLFESYSRELFERAIRESYSRAVRELFEGDLIPSQWHLIEEKDGWMGPEESNGVDGRRVLYK
jgi:hypothetical protein